MGIATNAVHREPWNKVEIVGQKAPFKLKGIPDWRTIAAGSRAALGAARRLRGFVCPDCAGKTRARFERGGLACWQCGSRARQCALTSGTVFESTELPLTLGLADRTQDHGGHAAARGSTRARWARGDRRRLSGWRALGRQDRAGRRGRLRYQLDRAFGRRGLRRAGVLPADPTRSCAASGHRDTRQQGGGAIAPIRRRQHVARQPGDRCCRHAPCSPIRQVRPSLPRRVPVPLQPPLRQQNLPPPSAPRSRGRAGLSRVAPARRRDCSPIRSAQISPWRRRTIPRLSTAHQPIAWQ